MNTRHRAKKVSPLVVLQMLARVQAGESPADIAAQHGIDKSTLYRWRVMFLKTPRLRTQLQQARSSIDQLIVGM